MLPEGIKKEDAIAFFRYSVIEPLIEAPKGQIRKIVKELSKRSFNDVVHKKIVSFSQRHIFRLYKAYREHGFDGLKPKQRSDKGTHPSITQDTINNILSLKKEDPARSAAKIITMLELAKEVPENVLKVRTVNRILHQYGYTRENLSKDTRVYRKFEKEHVNQMWISDVMEGFYIDFAPDVKKMCYLIGFEDVCSRVLTHAQFYFDSTLPKLEDSLRKAITKHGCPTKLHVDNGKIYVSDNFRLICAKLGIKLIYSTVYHPEGKGKCEKAWQYIQRSFIQEVRKRNVRSITELNDLFFAWLKREYHDRVHSSLGMTPMERWNLSLKQGQKLVFKSPLELDEIFLHEEERTVNKYGVISFEGNTYEVPGKLVQKKVTLKYDPFNLAVIKIYYNGKYIDTARVIDLSKTKHRDVEKVVAEPKEDTEISRLYFENLKINYKKYLEEQLLSSPDTSHIARTKDETVSQNPDDKPVYVPKDKHISFAREDFFKAVAHSLGGTQLSYFEKSKLYELWNSLKDFNEDIFKSLLSEIKDKTPDYNTNFIYYIEQIKNLYLQKINQKRRSL